MLHFVTRAAHYSGGYGINFDKGEKFRLRNSQMLAFPKNIRLGSFFLTLQI